MSDLDRDMDFAISGKPTNTGNTISEKTALNYSAYWSAVQQLSQTVASLPLELFKIESTDTDRRFYEHPLYSVLNVSPNGYQDCFQFKELLMYCLLVWGNFYAYIQRDTAYRVTALYPLNPCKINVELVNGIKIYKFKTKNGDEILYKQEEIYHVMNTSYNGLTGLSILELARESIGIGAAQEEFTGRFFGSSTNLGGVIKHPGHLNEQSLDNLKSSLRNFYSGLSNSHKTMILEEGMSFEKVSMPTKDAQLLEARQYSVQEMARWFNMPPHRLKDLSRSTFSNIESEQLSYYTDTIRPILVRIEYSTNNQLINPLSRRNSFVEFDFTVMLRADLISRYNGYASALQNGWMSRDEVRIKENLNPINTSGGKAFLAQLNLADIDKIVGGINEQQ